MDGRTVNRPKRIGTSFERAVADWLAERLDDPRIDRLALHGTKDVGDIGGLVAHGMATGIVECKGGHQAWERRPADLARWQRETETERGNADADFALLVVQTEGVGQKRLGLTDVWLTARSFDAMRGISYIPNDVWQRTADRWLRMTLEEAAKLIEGDG